MAGWHSCHILHSDTSASLFHAYRTLWHLHILVTQYNLFKMSKLLIHLQPYSTLLWKMTYSHDVNIWVPYSACHTHHFCLLYCWWAFRLFQDKSAGEHISVGYRRIRGLLTWLSGQESTCQCRRYRFDPWVGKILWRRKWQPTPLFLPGKSHGQRSLVGYNPEGCKDLDMTEATECAACT